MASCAGPRRGLPDIGRAAWSQRQLRVALVAIRLPDQSHGARQLLIEFSNPSRLLVRTAGLEPAPGFPEQILSYLELLSPAFTAGHKSAGSEGILRVFFLICHHASRMRFTADLGTG